MFLATRRKVNLDKKLGMVGDLRVTLARTISLSHIYVPRTLYERALLVKVEFLEQ